MPVVSDKFLDDMHARSGLRLGPQSLDDWIGCAHAAGTMHGLMLTRVSNGSWQASRRITADGVFRVRMHTDPVQALRLVLAEDVRPVDADLFE